MENYEKGIQAIEKYAGPAKEVLFKRINAFPKAYTRTMVEAYGERLSVLQKQFTPKEIAVGAFSCRLGAGLDLTPAVFGLLNAGYTKGDVENLVAGLTLLSGFGKANTIWTEINAAFAAWDESKKIRRVS